MYLWPSSPQERGYRGQSPLKHEFIAKTPLLSINYFVKGLCPLYPRSCGGLGMRAVCAQCARGLCAVCMQSASDMRVVCARCARSLCAFKLRTTRAQDAHKRAQTARRVLCAVCAHLNRAQNAHRTRTTARRVARVCARLGAVARVCARLCAVARVCARLCAVARVF